MKRRLAYQGWASRVADNRVLGCLFGSAVARGLAVWRSSLPVLSLVPSSMTPLTAALALLDAEWGRYTGAGVVFQDGAQDELRDAVSAVLTKYPEHDTLAGWTIAAVELDLGDAYGHARIDVLAKDAFGNYVIIDDKAKRRMEARWIPKEIAGYEHDWKMNHYCWAASEVYGVPITRYYINLIVASPRFSVTLCPYTAYSGHSREWWEASARRYWLQMAREDDYGDDYTPSMAVSHRSQYGWCEYKDACLTYNLDPAMMAVDYIQVARANNSAIL